MTQKSMAKGSQGGRGVIVIVGVTDGAAVEVGVARGAVAIIFVATATTGVSVTPVVVQDATINDIRRLNRCFSSKVGQSSQVHAKYLPGICDCSWRSFDGARS